MPDDTDEPRVVPEAAPEAAPAPVVLVIDHCPGRIDALSTALAHGHRVIVARSGSEGFALAGTQRPALILLGPAAPGSEGSEVLTWLAADPRASRIPVIVVLDRPDPETEARALTGGAVDVVCMPVDPGVLRARVAARLRFAATQRSLEQQRADLQAMLTDLERMERTALRLTESIPVGTYVEEIPVDGPSRFTFLSKRWLKMLDLTRAQVLSDPAAVLDRIHPDDIGSFVALDAEVNAKPRPFFWEGRIVVGGETRWVQIESVPRPLLDGGTAFEGVMIEITARKQAQQALQEAHARLTEAAIERSRIEERTRLLQDMHDGFGSQLASARLMAETGLISTRDIPVLLQECLADLHLVADTLGHPDNTLGDSLADLKYRIERRTQHMPVLLHWQTAIDDAIVLPQRTVLQVLRILQEALNNALRHSAAHCITVHVRLDREQGGLTMTVQDDGKGLAADAPPGWGLSNMRQRARAIGADLSVVSEGCGTRVTLSLAVGDGQRPA